MKKLLIVSFCCLHFYVGFSQSFSIKGTVKDAVGNPVAAAIITIAGTKSGSIADNQGTYSIEKLSKGTYVISTSCIGYESVEKTITVNNDIVVNFVMNKVATQINPVTITAIKAKDNTPVAVTNIGKLEVQQNNMLRDIPYQLEQMPSTVATSENGTGIGYTGMRIRGTDMSRINVTINGIPYNDAESQSVFWVDVSDLSSSIDNVQVQRGVGTSTNGAASFGASINFQTISVEENPYTRISSSIGSFGTFKESIAASTGIIDSCYGFTARLSKLNSEGWIDRGFSDHTSLHISGLYFKKKNTVTANVLLGKEHTGITWWGVPDYMIDSIRTYNPSGKYTDLQGNTRYYGETDNYIQNHYMLQFQHNFSDDLNATLSLHATTGEGYYEEYKSRFDDWGSENVFTDYGLANYVLPDTVIYIQDTPVVFPDSTIYSSDMLREKWLDNVFYGTNASINYSKNKLTWNLGTAFTIYDGNHYGLIKEVKYIPDFKEYEWYRNTSNKQDFNVFTKMQYAFTSAFSMYADIQYRYIEYHMKGIDDDLYDLEKTFYWNFINPKIGLFYKFNSQHSAFCSYSIANREPTRSDLKESLKTETTHKLSPETLYDYELGYNFKSKKLGVSVNLYDMEYDNQLVLTGKVNDVGSALMENVTDSYRRGIEISSGYKPVKEIEIQGNVTLSENKIRNYTEYASGYDENWNDIAVVNNLGTTDISYSPSVIAGGGLFFNPDPKMKIGFTSKYVSSQYFDNTSDSTRQIEAYTVHNFQIQYKIPIKKSELQIQLLVNNILDTKYISNAYGGNWFEQGVEKSWAYYFPQSGINYMCKATFEF